MSTCYIHINDHMLSSTQMKGFMMNYVCNRCNKSFVSDITSARPNPKYCSRKCVSGLLKFWDLASTEQKIKRLKEAFYKHINQTDSCWIWVGAIIRRYGILRFGRKNIRAHRASWIIHYGEIPNGMFVLHKCDVPLCVNPNHLFIGTAADNTQDMIRKGRGCFGINQFNKHKVKNDK